MPNIAVSALLQAAMRRRLLTREKASALGAQLAAHGVDVAELHQRLRDTDAPEAIMLRELLPAAELPAVAPYRRLARLGEGRTASTWLGAGPGPGGRERAVVIKVFHAARLPPGPAAARFVGDVQPLVGLEHRYLVDYLAAFTAADGRACLVQAYLPGRDLNSRAVTKGPMREAQALAVFRQATKGLAVLGQLGACHGLLHPGNILLETSGRARLSDYGLAPEHEGGAVRAGWEPRSLMMHAWSAPETMGETPAIGISSDCYALACIVWWLLAGKPPFPGGGDQQALQHAKAARPDVRVHAPQVSEITAKTLAKAMMAAPAQRYSSPRDLIGRIQRNLEQLAGHDPAALPTSSHVRASAVPADPAAFSLDEP